MKLKDLYFDFPEDLIATEPQRPSRVLYVGKGVKEITIETLLQQIPAGDVLVVNNTKVLKRRVFAGDLEILFLSSTDKLTWEVLFPSRKFSLGDVIDLPLGYKMTLVQKGRPQLVKVDQPLEETYFSQIAELPLPPYIQKMRKQRHAISADESWYQTAWASQPGSFAAPTASLHFSPQDIEGLKNRGVKVLELTLHVGLGTFLPVTVEDLDQHQMHQEYVQIPPQTWIAVQEAKRKGYKIWSLGTTATRALESVAMDYLSGSSVTGYSGFSKLLIQPGFEWTVVDRLLTNFHQPESTLLALVAGFAGLERLTKAYRFAIANKFKLFSYGDLSVWEKEPEALGKGTRNYC